MDQHFLPRPYDSDLPFKTLGYMADFEGGLQYKVWRRFTIGFSVWDVFPMGPQRIYSNIVWEQPTGEDILSVGAPNQVTTIGAPLPTSVGPGTFGYTVGDPTTAAIGTPHSKARAPRGLHAIMVIPPPWDLVRPSTWTS